MSSGTFTKAITISIATVIMFFTINCGDHEGSFYSDLFSEEEWEIVKSLSPMPSSPPPNHTNNYAENSDAAELGQHLFFDQRFSGNGNIACATCHSPSHGFADPEPTSLGVGRGNRNAPSLLNSGFGYWFFWNGRSDSLWSQALGPLESPIEHGGSRLQYAHLIFDHYREKYQKVFGDLPELSDFDRFPKTGKPGDESFDGMTEDAQLAVSKIYVNIGKAIEAYERKLLSRNSPFDRYVAGDKNAISPEAKNGLKIFIGEGDCVACHNGPNFTNSSFHNTGLGKTSEEDIGRFVGIPQLLENPFNGDGIFSDHRESSKLKYLQNDLDQHHQGAFKTPTLRSITETAPYFHDGSFATLEEVVEFYDRGGGESDFVGEKDPMMEKLDLSDEAKKSLVEFLKTLAGEPLPIELLKSPKGQ